jgi:hypothetical protein
MKSIKAQINQMFIWIMVLFIIGAVALIGVRSIGGLVEDKCVVDQVRFEDKLSEVIRLNNDFGSVNLESLTMPCGYHTICFADSRQLESNTIKLSNDDSKTLGGFANGIISSIEDGVSNSYLDSKLGCAF